MLLKRESKFLTPILQAFWVEAALANLQASFPVSSCYWNHLPSLPTQPTGSPVVISGLGQDISPPVPESGFSFSHTSVVHWPCCSWASPAPALLHSPTSRGKTSLLHVENVGDSWSETWSFAYDPLWHPRVNKKLLEAWGHACLWVNK